MFLRVLFAGVAISSLAGAGGFHSCYASEGKTQTIVVADQLTDNGNEIRIGSPYFNNNEKKVWVEVLMDNTRFPDNSGDQQRILVKGLNYDNSTKQLTYELGGKRVICANMEPPVWYRWASKLITTGACELRGKIDVRTGENEFGEKYEYSVLHIDMEVLVSKGT